MKTHNFLNMANVAEETLDNWRKPPSDSEDTKLRNSERMIREAISASDELNKYKVDVFGQGSYANDTNVRLNSDIDINVCMKDYVYFDLPDGKTREDYGYSEIDYTYHQFKAAVERALVAKFGQGEVIHDDKCITVKGSATRVEADVVPTWEYHRHDSGGGKAIGTKFITDAGIGVVNYPLQHIENGKSKNVLTQRRFKRLTRILKRLRFKMIEDGLAVNENITSFLLECLVWNVPNSIFNDKDSWTERLEGAILYIYSQLKEDGPFKEWGEVSELLYLFRSSRKWSAEDVKEFLSQSYTYLGF